MTFKVNTKIWELNVGEIILNIKCTVSTFSPLWGDQFVFRILIS